MKRIWVLSTLLFSMASQAAWYEDKEIEWWMVVYSQMSCVKAEQFGADYHPVNLINLLECVYEEDNSTQDHIASIGCEKNLNTGFIFTSSEYACDVYISSLKEMLQAAN